MGLARLIEKLARRRHRKEDNLDSHGKAMRGVNIYWQKFGTGDGELDFREAVGGLWEELGDLQLEFMKNAGLRPEHRLLDIGCGSLRGGIRFVDYLEQGNYYGLDVNASLIDAGRQVLETGGLSSKEPHLLVDDTFRFHRFDACLDFALAVSVFTHLPAEHISRCLAELRPVLKEAGRFYFSYFEAPDSKYHEPIIHEPGGIKSFPDRDPFHYRRGDLLQLTASHGMNLSFLGDWGHPRGQLMACAFLD